MSKAEWSSFILVLDHHQHHLRILPHGSPKHISRWISAEEDLELSHNAGLLHHRKAVAIWTRMPLPNEEVSLRFVVATGRPTGQTRHLQQRKERNRCEGFSGSVASDSNIRAHALLCRRISKQKAYQHWISKVQTWIVQLPESLPAEVWPSTIFYPYRKNQIVVTVIILYGFHWDCLEASSSDYKRHFDPIFLNPDPRFFHPLSFFLQRQLQYPLCVILF
ncbi:hypothetical protein M422DRAFT_243825 [Sphaerobolus stellatus SS14]|nr:hypothetical protein M422DRAFT_243825 [Sphaerobolus stellatus SS14]